MNRKRLRKLANFLMTLPPKRFQMHDWADGEFLENACGTSACALGWTPTCFPKSGFRLVKYEMGDPKENHLYPIYNGKDGFYAAVEFFDISYSQAEELFGEGNYPKFNAGPKHVAKRILKFLKENDGNYLKRKARLDAIETEKALARSKKRQDEISAHSYGYDDYVNGW